MRGNVFANLMRGPGFTRRDALRALASVGVGVATIPLLPRLGAAADQVSVYTWSGYDDPRLCADYVKKHGAPPNFSFFGDTSEALNKLQAGYKVDVAHPCADDMTRWVGTGVVKPIDESRLEHFDEFWPELKNLPGTVSADGKQRFFVPFDWGNSSVVYRTDKVDVKDPSWRILYDDDRYKGKVAMYDSGPPAVEIAGAILGAKDIFNMTDAEIEEAAKLLRRQREQVKFYWSDNSTIEQGLASGELVAAYSWNDSVRRLKKQGVPVAYMDPKEGMRTWVCGLVMPKDVEHEDLAYDFINAFTSPETGVVMLDEFGTGHVNKKSFDMVNKETLDGLGLDDPTTMMKRTVFLRAVNIDREQKYNEVFNTVKAGG
jgi:spermidine/putrescine transport system substrate-binding protein